jgi:hypothetical protein
MLSLLVSTFVGQERGTPTDWTFVHSISLSASDVHQLLPLNVMAERVRPALVAPGLNSIIESVPQILFVLISAGRP